MMRRVLVLGLLAFAACDHSGGSGGPGACATSGTGTLQIAISGLPAGVNANVTVSGVPMAVTGSTSLTAAGGMHTIAAPTLTVADPIVRKAFTASVSSASACVRDGQTTMVQVTYSLVPTSNHAWVIRGGASQLGGHASDALLASGSPAANPAVTVSLTNPNALAFDSDGNLWMSQGAGTVSRFPAASLAATGSPTADVTISGSALSGGAPGPSALAFDRSGNLWVAVTFSNQIIRYSPSQLTTGGPTPSVVLGGTGNGVDGPSALAFDSTGNLWVASGGSSRVVRYDAAHLSASSTAAPDRTIEAQTPGPSITTLATPVGLAFDRLGQLWVSYFGPNIVARLIASDLSGTGSAVVTPTIQIGFSVTVLLQDIAFDEGSGLWLVLGTGGFGRLTPEQLGTSGIKAPATQIMGSNASGFAFYPAPAATPLFDALP